MAQWQDMICSEERKDEIVESAYEDHAPSAQLKQFRCDTGSSIRRAE